MWGDGISASGHWPRALAIFLSIQVCDPDAATFQTCPVQVVTREELLQAMRLHGDYDIDATPNLARFQTDVFLQLARWAHRREQQGGPLLIRADDWFLGYLEVSNLTAETAPEAFRRAHEVGQIMQLDYRADRVILEQGEGPKPLVALNVRIWWQPGPGVPSKYSYRDTLSVPRLSVTSQQMITYRLLEFDHLIAYDQIRGISGRPTSGLLGVLFRLLGEGDVVDSRMTVSPDGLQVVVARSKRVFTLSVTVTVYPDGHGEKGLPVGRGDLEALEARLRRPIPVKYAPYTC